MSRAVRQRGLSLVELLVGTAIGLFLVAIGVTLLSGHLRQQRALTLESRLMLDLRACADLIGRDLRRAGFWGDAAAGVWRSGAGAVASNPYTAIAPAAAASDTVTFGFSRDDTENQQLDSNERFGFRLRKGVVEMMLGDGNWQALTDSTSLTVTAFEVTPRSQEVALERFCTSPCPLNSSSCPPRQQVRSLDVAMTARSANDAGMQRSLRSSIRLRNDAVVGACAG